MKGWPAGTVSRYGKFDTVLDHFALISLLYLVPMRIGY